jgi:hypothetical protein
VAAFCHDPLQAIVSYTFTLHLPLHILSNLPFAGIPGFSRFQKYMVTMMQTVIIITVDATTFSNMFWFSKDKAHHIPNGGGN